MPRRPDGCGIQNYIVIEYDSIEYGIRYDRIRSLPVVSPYDASVTAITTTTNQPTDKKNNRNPTDKNNNDDQQEVANDNKQMTTKQRHPTITRSVSYLIESDLIRSDQMLLFYATMITTIHNR